MYHISHQNIAQKLIAEYQGPTPLALYLKKYFAANKKHGSKDRKSISALCYDHFRNLSAQFPLQALISPVIDLEKFKQSHVQQPLLFIRIRPGKKEVVEQALQKASIVFEKINDTTFSFANTTALQNVIQPLSCKFV